MLSPADMLVVGVAALLFFGPDQLPKVARRAGQVVREVQATSASFIHEMERAADESDHRTAYVPPEPYAPQAETVTVDHETTEHDPHLPTDHDWHVSADLEPHTTTAHDVRATLEHEPTSANGASHAIIGDVEPKPPAQAKGGSSEADLPHAEPRDSGASS